MYICKYCNTEFEKTKSKKRKFCSMICCYRNSYYIKGEPIYVGHCECGCGGLWVSRKGPQKYIKKHKKGPSSPCNLCFKDSNNFNIKQQNYNLRVCEDCYLKIMKLKEEPFYYKMEKM